MRLEMYSYLVLCAVVIFWLNQITVAMPFDDQNRLNDSKGDDSIASQLARLTEMAIYKRKLQLRGVFPRIYEIDGRLVNVYASRAKHAPNRRGRSFLQSKSWSDSGNAMNRFDTNTVKPHRPCHHSDEKSVIGTKINDEKYVETEIPTTIQNNNNSTPVSITTTATTLPSPIQINNTQTILLSVTPSSNERVAHINQMTTEQTTVDDIIDTVASTVPSTPLTLATEVMDDMNANKFGSSISKQTLMQTSKPSTGDGLESVDSNFSTMSTATTISPEVTTEVLSRIDKIDKQSETSSSTIFSTEADRDTNIFAHGSSIAEQTTENPVTTLKIDQQIEMTTLVAGIDLNTLGNESSGLIETLNPSSTDDIWANIDQSMSLILTNAKNPLDVTTEMLSTPNIAQHNEIPTTNRPMDIVIHQGDQTTVIDQTSTMESTTNSLPADVATVVLSSSWESIIATTTIAYSTPESLSQEPSTVSIATETIEIFPMTQNSYTESPYEDDSIFERSTTATTFDPSKAMATTEKATTERTEYSTSILDATTSESTTRIDGIFTQQPESLYTLDDVFYASTTVSDIFELTSTPIDKNINTDRVTFINNQNDTSVTTPHPAISEITPSTHTTLTYETTTAMPSTTTNTTLDTSLINDRTRTTEKMSIVTDSIPFDSLDFESLDLDGVEAAR